MRIRDGCRANMHACTTSSDRLFPDLIHDGSGTAFPVTAHTKFFSAHFSRLARDFGTTSSLETDHDSVNFALTPILSGEDCNDL